jgi:hypothetical protein
MQAKENLTTLCGLSREETELDFSGLFLHAGDAVLIANDISDMGAISTVIINVFPLPIQDIKSKAELDFSGKALEVEDAIIIAALIPSNVSHTIYHIYLPPVITNIPVCDKGALSQFDISKNSLQAAGTKHLAEALKDNRVITELNISSNGMSLNSWGGADMSGVTALADVIPDMRALSSLNLSSNMLTGEYGGEMAGNIHADYLHD